ncbi:MAG: PP0621 family protein [Campylobacterota bacterium]|nr:PP0621 family protein [Campylobacterota bacterium]
MILKFLLVIGVIAFVYFLFIKKKPTISKSKKPDKEEDFESNDMIECEKCGIYCEIDDMILSNNKYYCSSECIGAK